MTAICATQDEAILILTEIDRLGIKQAELAAAIGIDQNMVSKVRRGTRRFKATEVSKAQEWLADRRKPASNATELLDAMNADPAYFEIEVLPTYAGAGGGGNGEGDRNIAIMSRRLIVDQLHGRPQDFIMIDVRGDSMKPDFEHGDELLVDKRDTSPAQPGPFAIWDGEWGEYVIKNVERLQGGKFRMFSTNTKYRDAIVESENTRIVGRVVWCGRMV